MLKQDVLRFWSSETCHMILHSSSSSSSDRLCYW